MITLCLPFFLSPKNRTPGIIRPELSEKSCFAFGRRAKNTHSVGDTSARLRRLQGRPPFSECFRIGGNFSS
jgi:hypothetical protein